MIVVCWFSLVPRLYFPAFFSLILLCAKKRWEVEPGNEAMLVSYLISELIFVLEEDVHSDANKVDAAVHLQGNTVVHRQQIHKVNQLDISMTRQYRPTLIISHIIHNNLGTASLIQDHPSLLVDSTSTEQLCQKDTGLGKRLRKWSRGHQFVVVVEVT